MDKFAFSGDNPGWLKVPCSCWHYDSDTAQKCCSLVNVPFQADPSATIREWLDFRLAAVTKGHARLSLINVISGRTGTETIFYNVNSGYMGGRADLIFMLDYRMDEVFTVSSALTIREKVFKEP